MKLRQATEAGWEFELEKREHHALSHLLGLYPLVPAGHHELSRGEDRPEDEALLQSALAEQQTGHRTRVREWLDTPGRFSPRKQGVRMTVAPGDLEWLLQVINDVRVGGWLALGAPEDPAATRAAVKPENIQYLWAMEVAGFFLNALVSARAEPPSPAADGAPTVEPGDEPEDDAPGA